MKDGRVRPNRPRGIRPLTGGSLALLLAMALPSTAQTPTLSPASLPPPTQPLPYRTYASSTAQAQPRNGNAFPDSPMFLSTAVCVLLN